MFGCGGVGLSAVMIATALKARVIAVDVSARALDAAADLGAAETVRADASDPAAVIHDLTDGGAHISIDAIGSPASWRTRCAAFVAEVAMSRSACCSARTR